MKRLDIQKFSTLSKEAMRNRLCDIRKANAQIWNNLSFLEYNSQAPSSPIQESFLDSSGAPLNKTKLFKIAYLHALNSLCMWQISTSKNTSISISTIFY